MQVDSKKPNKKRNPVGYCHLLSKLGCLYKSSIDQVGLECCLIVDISSKSLNIGLKFDL